MLTCETEQREQDFSLKSIHQIKNWIIQCTMGRRSAAIFYLHVISYISFQSCELNLCAKLEYCIKHLQIKHCFQPICSRIKLSLPGKLAQGINTTIEVAAIRKATVFFFLHNKWLVPQSVQIKLNNKRYHIILLSDDLRFGYANVRNMEGIFFQIFLITDFGSGISK